MSRRQRNERSTVLTRSDSVIVGAIWIGAAFVVVPLARLLFSTFSEAAKILGGN